MNMLKELLEAKRDDILRIADEHGVIHIRTFGSTVSDHIDEHSDIDFLVDMEKGRSLLDMGGFLMEMQDLLGRHVDVVTENGETISKDGLLIRSREKGILDVLDEIREIDNKRTQLIREVEKVKHDLDKEQEKQPELAKKINEYRDQLRLMEKESMQLKSVSTRQRQSTRRPHR